MDIRRRAMGKALLIQSFDSTCWPQWARNMKIYRYIHSIGEKWYLTAVGELVVGMYLVEDESGRHSILSAKDFEDQWVEVED